MLGWIGALLSGFSVTPAQISITPAPLHMLIMCNEQEFVFLHIVFILDLFLEISHHDPVGCGEYRKKGESSELVCNPSANWHSPSGDSWVAATNPEITTKDLEAMHRCRHAR